MKVLCKEKMYTVEVSTDFTHKEVNLSLMEYRLTL